VPIEFHVSAPCFFPTNLIADLTSAALAMVSISSRIRVSLRPASSRNGSVCRRRVAADVVAVDFGLVRVGDQVEDGSWNSGSVAVGFQLMLGNSRDAWGLEGISTLPGELDRATYLRTVGDAIVHGHGPRSGVDGD
jgi:hypothetical protein